MNEKAIPDNSSILMNMKYYLEKFLDLGLWIYAFAYSFASSFIAPLLPFLVFVIALVTCDAYSGIKAAKKRGEKIQSRGMRRSIEKITLYFIAILLSEGMVQVFSIPKIPFTDFTITYIVAFAIALIEFQSNIENIEAVTGAKIWTYIAERVKSMMPKMK